MRFEGSTRIRLLFLATAVVACTQAAQPTPSSAPSATPGPTSIPTAAASTPLPTAEATEDRGSPSAPAVDLAEELVQPGQLTICSAFPRTRFAERDAQGNPFGVDIDIGLAIAGQLGLEPVVVELAFEELIDAVVGGRCDLTISGHFITRARLERIDLIPYREGSVNVVVRAGNPLGIEQLTDLCGKTAAIVAGTIYFDIVRGLGDYSGDGIDQQCLQAGRPAVNLAEFATEGDAEAAFAGGDADAFIGNEAIALDRPAEFELSEAALPRLRNGIGHRLGAMVLDEALRAALRDLIADGTYAAILERYGVSGIEVTELP